MRKLIILLGFATSAYAVDFTATTPTSAIGAGSPSRAITLAVTSGPTASSTSFALSDGGVGGVFYPASPITLASGAALTQFVYIAPVGTTATVTLSAAATGGIAATHTLALPIGTATNFVRDTFTGTAGTALVGHTPNTGATWALCDNATGGPVNAKLNGSGAIYDSSTGHASDATCIPTAPAATEHDVSVNVANVNLASAYPPDLALFVANNTSAASTGYRFVFSSGVDCPKIRCGHGDFPIHGYDQAANQ